MVKCVIASNALLNSEILNLNLKRDGLCNLSRKIHVNIHISIWSNKSIVVQHTEEKGYMEI